MALDEFMVERLSRKADVRKKIQIVPPWPHIEPPLEEAALAVLLTEAGTRFRRQHGLTDLFVVMYSGNNAHQHPLDTLLDVAVLLEADAGIRFVFIGGGVGKATVDRRLAAGATNIQSEALEESLGAADLHVVSTAYDAVGIMHPCKIYGAMSVGRPIQFFGPHRSHAEALVENLGIAWRIDHGDVDAMDATMPTIRSAAKISKAERLGLRAAGAPVIARDLSQRALVARIGDIVDGIRCQLLARRRPRPQEPCPR